MTLIIEFLWSCINKVWSTLESFTFNLFGYDTNLMFIFFALFSLAVTMSLINKVLGFKLGIDDVSVAGVPYIDERTGEQKFSHYIKHNRK